MKLREIAKEYREVAALLDSDDEGIAIAVRDTLDAITGEFEHKAQAVVAIAQNLDADCAVIDAEIERLQAIKKARVTRAAELREYLRSNMEATGIKKISCPLFCITLAAGREVAVIDDEAAIPDDLVKVKTEVRPDKAEILRQLKAGEAVPGAHLERGQSSIRIK
jgi:hypothetical protein